MNGNSTLSFTLWFTESLLSKCLMKNIEAGTAAPLFSTVGPIWLGHQPKKHVQPCHFHCFLSILIENTGGKDFNEFLTDIQSF